MEALSHANRFDPSRPSKAWLLGIAANLVKRRQAARAKQFRRGNLARDFGQVQQDQDLLSDDEVFDRLAELNLLSQRIDTPERVAIENEDTNRLLAPLSEQDREIIDMALLRDLNTEELAQDLNTTPGAARVRLTRALNKLRRTWNTKEANKGNK